MPEAESRFAFDLRRAWLALVCLILGPLSPWMAYLGKLRRRGLAAPGWWLVLSGLFVAVYLTLWAAPLRWEWVVALYLGLGAASGMGFHRAGALRYFKPFGQTVEKEGDQPVPPWSESLAVGALAVFPCLFGYGLIRDVDHLREFAIHLPASVYTEALTFAALYGTPAAAALGGLVRWARFRPGLRLVLNLYGGFFVVLLWISLWGRLHQFALSLFGSDAGSLVLFDPRGDATFRSWVHGVFYSGGVFLGAAYLASAGRSMVFGRRAMFLSLPVLLGYANFTLLLGGGEPFLAGLRSHLYQSGHYRAFRVAAEVEAARFPRSLHVPFLMQNLADLAYFQGREKESGRWRKSILASTQDQPYFSALVDQIAWQEAHAPVGCAASEPVTLLPVPRVRPSAALDGNWYALLSAVAFFQPGWSDFDLKKRLLDVSPDVQLSVPTLGGVPSVAEVLDIFGLPFSPCFLDSLRLHEALRLGKLPFISYEGRWIPLVGWDPCRRGFLGYRYPDSMDKNPWLNPADKEGLFGAAANHPKAASGIPYNLIVFLPEHQVLRHVHDIGGVALVLGDSAFASPAERRAAFLTEYGDVLYQEHDDNQGAAEAYAAARALHPSDYITARMAYLERRARWAEGPGYGVEAVFRRGVAPNIATGLRAPERESMGRRILKGDMGQYLLVNWVESEPRFFAGQGEKARAASRAAYRTWLELQSHNPAALDSLAMGFEAQERWDSAEIYFRRVAAFYPLGNEYAAYRLAWVLFKQERFEEAEQCLDRCPYFRGEARTLLMRGAADWQAGDQSRGREQLEQSLKLDKGLPETHAWLERLAVAEGDSLGAALHRHWRERTKP